jgi:hypothetical protein
VNFPMVVKTPQALLPLARSETVLILAVPSILDSSGL